MKVILICALFLVLLALGVASGGKPSPPYRPTVYRLTHGNFLACRNDEKLKTIIRYAVENDKDAYMQASLAAVDAGDCIYLKVDDLVYRVDVGFSLMQVRLKGETSEYWVSREALDSAKEEPVTE